MFSLPIPPKKSSILITFIGITQAVNEILIFIQAATSSWFFAKIFHNTWISTRSHTNSWGKPVDTEIQIVRTAIPFRVRVVFPVLAYQIC